MSPSAKPCSACGKEVAPATIEVMAGEEADVRMRIEGMPALACAEGHRRFLAPDFAIRLMQALSGESPLAPVAAAVQKGLLRKRLHCPACGKELGAAASELAQVSRTLEIGGGSAFSVRVEMPKYHCAACGKECVPPEKILDEALMKASVHAFRAAGVRPT
jgi:DNA-directed RNA polymerase subunit RPC12/RpoP